MYRVFLEPGNKKVLYYVIKDLLYVSLIVFGFKEPKSLCNGLAHYETWHNPWPRVQQIAHFCDLASHGYVVGSCLL